MGIIESALLILMILLYLIFYLFHLLFSNIITIIVLMIVLIIINIVKFNTKNINNSIILIVCGILNYYYSTKLKFSYIMGTFSNAKSPIPDIDFNSIIFFLTAVIGIISIISIIKNLIPKNNNKQIANQDMNKNNNTEQQTTENNIVEENETKEKTYSKEEMTKLIQDTEKEYKYHK